MNLPQPGSVFAGRYRIESVLGEGGFATVFAAIDTTTNRRVALKVLRPDDGDRYDPSTRPRFQREVDILANLHSPHTVRLLHSGEAEGLLFMVFEMLGGEDLAGVLARRGRLAPSEVESIMRQVLASLSEAHQRGLFHRDLKPENIRLEEQPSGWHVTLLDFGLARAAGRESPAITKTGEILGTPKYMAPEQLMEQPLTPAADIYALGVVAFELLMGSDSLHGARWGDQLERLRTGHVFSIPDLDQTGAKLARLLMLMTARQPTDRPQSARAVLQMLDAPNLPEPRPSLPSRSSISTERAVHSSISTESPAHSSISMEIVANASRRTLWGTAIILIALCAAAAAGVYVVMRGSEPAAPTPDPRRTPSIVRGTPAPVGLEKAPKAEPEPIAAPAQPDMARKLDPVGCGSDPPFTGLGILSARIGLEQDAWSAYIPTSYEPDTPVPLVVFLHQTAELPVELFPHTGLEELAERDGWVLLLPRDDLTTPWTKPERLELVADRVAKTSEQLCIDPQRIFLIGQGQGGRAAEQLSCEPWVRAIATNSFRSSVGEDFCPDTPTAHMMLTPTDSPREPLEGGKAQCEQSLSGSERPMRSLADAEEAMKSRNGCRGEPKSGAGHAKCHTWTCDAPAVSCLVPGGHGWPGAPPRKYMSGLLGGVTEKFLEECDGTPGDFPTADVIWSFFKNLPNHVEE